MSTDYYLVDPEGRNVLDVGSWYALALKYPAGCWDEEAPLTEAILDTLDPADRRAWTTPIVRDWWKRRAEGRTVYLRHEQGNTEWEDPDTYDPKPDWTAETVYRKAARGWTPYPWSDPCPS